MGGALEPLIGAAAGTATIGMGSVACAMCTATGSRRSLYYSYGYEGPYVVKAFEGDGTPAATWESDALGRATEKRVYEEYRVEFFDDPGTACATPPKIRLGRPSTSTTSTPRWGIVGG